jgi:hypothetical protein
VPGGEPVAYSERLSCGVVELKTLLTPDWKLIVNVTAPATPGRYTLRLTLTFGGHKLETGDGANLYEASVEVR